MECRCVAVIDHFVGHYRFATAPEKPEPTAYSGSSGRIPKAT
ncbi:hypothetical protein D039_2859 [Vibrio parahaemolyticus EKP-028]|nr:hypothetical protein D039_2859 [Vibrio parahaemolyticus EKP-028]